MNRLEKNEIKKKNILHWDRLNVILMRLLKTNDCFKDAMSISIS